MTNPDLTQIIVASLLARVIKLLKLEDRVGHGPGHVSIAVGRFTVMIVDERA